MGLRQVRPDLQVRQQPGGVSQLTANLASSLLNDDVNGLLHIHTHANIHGTPLTPQAALLLLACRYFLARCCLCACVVCVTCVCVSLALLLLLRTHFFVVCFLTSFCGRACFCVSLFLLTTDNATTAQPLVLVLQTFHPHNEAIEPPPH